MQSFECMLILAITVFLLPSTDSICSANDSLRNVPTTGIESFQLSEEEIKDLEVKAGKSDPESLFRLSNYYEFVEDNDRQAFILLQKAARAGHPVAQFNYAYTLKNMPDINCQKESILWYEKAANNHKSSAMLELAKIYDEGEIVERDQIKAKSWYEKAATSGNPTGVLKLIEIFIKNDYKLKDPIQAYTWVLVAEKMIHPDSVSGQEVNDTKNQIRKLLEPGDIEIAKKHSKAILKEMKVKQ